MDELIDIAKQVVDKTDAQYGILHRPNKGPDYIMVFQAYGNNFVDPETGNLLLERDKLAAAFGWFERGVKEGVIPANNTAMEFDALRKEFYTGNAAFWMYGIWDLGTYAFPTYGLPSDEAAFFADWGWIASPPAEKGGSAEQPDAPDRLCGRGRRGGSGARRPAARASPRMPTSTPIMRSPRRISASSRSSSRTRATPRPGRSRRATELLEITKFLPNNPQFGDLNAIIYTAHAGRRERAPDRARRRPIS